jgi:hypothetical protein
VQELGFEDTCALAGVTVEAVPLDFAFESARRIIAARLQADIEAAAERALQDLLALEAASDPAMEAAIERQMVATPLASILPDAIQQAKTDIAAGRVQPIGPSERVVLQ